MIEFNGNPDSSNRNLIVINEQCNCNFAELSVVTILLQTPVTKPNNIF